MRNRSEERLIVMPEFVLGCGVETLAEYPEIFLLLLPPSLPRPPSCSFSSSISFDELGSVGCLLSELVCNCETYKRLVGLFVRSLPTHNTTTENRCTYVHAPTGIRTGEDI
jgi:hypothetical protein